MYEVKLCKGLSYSGFIHATIKAPIVELDTKEEADKAVATGYFVSISSPDVQEDDCDIDIKKMTKPQLEKCAMENGIDLTGCKNNEERIAKILASTPPYNSAAENADGESKNEGGNNSDNSEDKKPDGDNDMEIKMD